MTNHTCVQCADSIASSTRIKFCSDLCSWRAKEDRKRASGYYQRENVRTRQAEYKRRKYREDVEVGLESGAALSRWAAHGKGAESQCSLPACSRSIYAKLLCKPHYAEANGWVWSGTNHKARAEFYGVLFEAFSRTAVFERDDWICGICSTPVDPSLEYPDPMSVSLDHAVPMSRGGGHLMANCQCSHLDCNTRKGARYDREAGLPRSPGVRLAEVH